MSGPPPGWIMSTVGQVGEVSLGRQRAPKYHHGEGMRPYLRVANVFEDRIDTTDVMQMTFSDDEFERYRLRPGDVLLNEGQSPHLLGRPAIYHGQPPDVAFTNSLIRFRAGPGVTPEWALAVFRHYMRSRRFMRESRITTNIAHLSATRFSTVEFPVPPVAEQDRIVAEIEEQFSRLDAGVAALRLVQRNLKRIRAAFFLELHDKALLDSLPRSLKEVSEFIVDGDHNPPRRVDKGVPYLTAKHVKRGQISIADASFISPEDFTSLRRRYDPRKGDVLVTCVGTLGEVAVVPGGLTFAADRNLAAIRPSANIIPSFLEAVLASPRIRKILTAGSGSTAQPHLYLKDLRGLQIPAPPVDIQESLVITLREQLAFVDQLETDVKRAATRSERLRASILMAASSGRLVPQDPGDESASALLERIAAERMTSNGRRSMRVRNLRAPWEKVNT